MKPPDPSTPHWRRLDEIFQAAVDQPAEERDAFLERACAGDAELRSEVAALLRSDAIAGGFLENVIGGEAGRMVGVPSPPTPQRFGPYRIVGDLGRGGMGAVYLAVRDDDEYRKQVAVKLLHRGLETGEAVARFRDERQILAAFEHPGIVRLLDGGSTEEGWPYLVMERVEGVPITDYCEGRGLTVRDRLALFRQVCAAVQYAHQRLVIHRDIKPGNILVGADGTPKLLDFGIAKLLDPDQPGGRPATVAGLHRLTPEYASPEQARGEPVTTATDVYSLGAVLYELLTGARPHRFEGATVVQMLHALSDVDPPRPSLAAAAVRRRALRGDLDTIVMKALEKEPGRRYASAEQLSEDLRRHLEGRPIAARAGTWVYRTGKFVRRQRALVAAAAVVLVTLTAATIVSLQQARRAQRRFLDVRHLATSLLFEVDESIRGLEGSTAARELIVTRALQYLDSLAQEADDDPALSRELAAAYVKVGQIQGSSRAPSLGRPRDAIESHRKAVAILQRLAASGQDDVSTRWLRARALYSRGDLYRAERQLGPARESLREATRLVQSIPRTADFDHEAVVMGYLALFAVEEETGSPAAMAEVARDTLEAARAMARSRDSPEAGYWMGIAHEMAGLAQARAADPEGAVRAYDEARTIFTALVAEHPQRAAYRRELSLSHARVAGHLSGTGESSVWEPSLPDLRRAEDMMRRALHLRESQLERDPNDQRAAVETANRFAQLGAILSPGVPHQAIPLFERAVEMHRRLPGPVRRSGYSRQLEWFTHCSMAEPLARVGRRGEAVAAIQEGLAIVEEDAREAGFEKDLALLMCRYQAARARRALGEAAVAADQLAEVAAGLRRLIAAQPSHIVPYIGLVDTLRLHAETSPRARCAKLEEADSAWRSWPAASTSFTRLRQAEIAAALASCRPRG
jgi:serine/threonine protein kinase